MSRTAMNVEETIKSFTTKLKTGDPVMVITGGNKKATVLKGQTGKLLSISAKTGKAKVEGLKIIKKHKKALRSDDTSGIISKEGWIDISNIMYYRDDIKRPVRIKFKKLDDGRKVRGFINPTTKKFEQIDV